MSHSCVTEPMLAPQILVHAHTQEWTDRRTKISGASIGSVTQALRKKICKIRGENETL